MKSYEFNGKVYLFRLSRKAKIELEERMNQQNTLFNDPDLVDVLPLLLTMQSGHSLNEVEEEKLKAKMVPLLQRINQSSQKIDPFEVGYILLKNHQDFLNLPREEFDALEWDMEEKLGFEEAYAFFQELSDTVFTFLSNMNH